MKTLSVKNNFIIIFQVKWRNACHYHSTYSKLGTDLTLWCLLLIRFQWRGLLVSVGGLLGLSLFITAVIIGVYNTDVLEAGQVLTG